MTTRSFIYSECVYVSACVCEGEREREKGEEPWSPWPSTWASQWSQDQKLGLPWRWTSVGHSHRRHLSSSDGWEPTKSGIWRQERGDKTLTMVGGWPGRKSRRGEASGKRWRIAGAEPSPFPPLTTERGSNSEMTSDSGRGGKDIGGVTTLHRPLPVILEILLADVSVVTLIKSHGLSTLPCLHARGETRGGRNYNVDEWRKILFTRNMTGRIFWYRSSLWS